MCMVYETILFDEIFMQNINHLNYYLRQILITIIFWTEKKNQL